MSRRYTAPLTIHVPSRRLAGLRPVAWHVLARCRLRSESARLHASFRFKNDEGLFARRLARRKSNLWVFRSNQQRSCGDFVVVDMSSPEPKLRRVFVIDLKAGAPLKLGGGGVGIQFLNAGLAVRDIAQRAGIIPTDTAFELASGDRAELFRYLCAVLRRRARARRRSSIQPSPECPEYPRRPPGDRLRRRQAARRPSAPSSGEPLSWRVFLRRSSADSLS